uniref:Tripartite motif-containing protein 2 n=1 Tax=Strongyloides stercoralis TaxID=6248 RepID=A0A0K0ERG5_STRER
MSSDWIVDEEHVAKLELKLKNLKEKKVTSAEVIKQLEEVNFFQLSCDNVELGFEDNFVDDKVIDNTWLKKKITPQNCAKKTMNNQSMEYDRSEYFLCAYNNADSLHIDKDGRRMILDIFGNLLYIKDAQIESSYDLLNLIDKGEGFTNERNIVEVVSSYTKGDKLAVAWTVFNMDYIPLYSILTLFDIVDDIGIVLCVGQKIMDSIVNCTNIASFNGKDYAIFQLHDTTPQIFEIGTNTFESVSDPTTVSHIFRDYPTNSTYVKTVFYSDECYDFCIAFNDTGKLYITLASKEKFLTRRIKCFNRVLSFIKFFKEKGDSSIFKLITTEGDGPVYHYNIEVNDGDFVETLNFQDNTWDDYDLVTNIDFNSDMSEYSISTYGGGVFVYKYFWDHSTLHHVFRVDCPVTTIKYIDDSSYAILSNNGLHIYRRIS